MERFSRVLPLAGTKFSMGKEYGGHYDRELREIYDIYYGYCITEQGHKLSDLEALADEFYSQYPFSYQQFINGMAIGANITLNQAKILNGIEVLVSICGQKASAEKNEDAIQIKLSACSFASVPGIISENGNNILARNYDFPKPYDKIANYLAVTIFSEEGLIPTAIIGFVGQYYCNTCINRNSLFLELNNGMPSGGYERNSQRESLLIALLRIIENSSDFEQMNKQLNSLESDFSLIINAANSSFVKSYEYSTKSGMKTHLPTSSKPFISTNYFQSIQWGVDYHKDKQPWFSSERKNNLERLFNTKNKFSVNEVQELMEVRVENGGAFWEATIYQIIFDSQNMQLFIRIPGNNESWQNIDLNSYFGRESHFIDYMGEL